MFISDPIRAISEFSVKPQPTAVLNPSRESGANNTGAPVFKKCLRIFSAFELVQTERQAQRRVSVAIEIRGCLQTAAQPAGFQIPDHVGGIFDRRGQRLRGIGRRAAAGRQQQAADKRCEQRGTAASAMAVAARQSAPSPGRPCSTCPWCCPDCAWCLPPGIRRPCLPATPFASPW